MADSKTEKVTRKWEKDHPAEFKKNRKARSKVNNNLRDGRIKKPSKCPHCGRSYATVRAEYDHHSKPPGWSCAFCNLRGRAASKGAKKK